MPYPGIGWETLLNPRFFLPGRRFERAI
jgi:hypothetical protein